MTDFEIEFYKSENGDVPVKDFILSLDTKMKANMLRCIDILKKNGNDLREPYTKPLANGIFELRAKQGSDISRVLYFFVIERKIILTNGFIKKTVKDHLKKLALPKNITKIILRKMERSCNYA